MKAQHTPGPWNVCYDGQIDSKDGIRICSFDWDSYNGFNKSNNAANARLIASAPDLLEALRNFVDGCSSIVDAGAVARAAIAKATGEAP